MSFSSDVKEELAKQVSKSRHCQLAELAGIIELSGRINEKTKAILLNYPSNPTGARHRKPVAFK